MQERLGGRNNSDTVAGKYIGGKVHSPVFQAYGKNNARKTRKIKLSRQGSCPTG